ncbi:uncharacterized protein LOC125748000 isoform X1 [Brienomyrus brachyistius]|uniref:uncharacterized protein LOC125748000 isoform X1 n=1 Tax=Brienomyrus brachyistius TaxID=42636 RepID=UPI0020B30D1E|nr:uncharacterized protein LOC125748000 isoform X1 [Brienomyrus brachyistius]
MTRLQNLNAYLTERLMVAARDILEVVGNTISEYQKETARTIKENEELRRRLREIGVQANLEFFDSGHPVAPPVSIGSAPQSPQPHKPQCNSGLEEDREPPQTDIKQEFLEQHESKPEQGAVDLNKQASALTCAENPSEHRILQPSLPFEEKTEEVGCLPLMLPDQIKSELDELDYNIQKQSIASQPVNRVNNNSNTAESKNCAERKWMDRGGVMAEPNEQDSSREVCDIPVGGGSQHLPCTSLRAEKGDKPTITSKAAQRETALTGQERIYKRPESAGMDGATPPPAIPEALLNEIDIINDANNENDADYSAQHDSPPAASDETVAPPDSELWEALSDAEFLLDAEEIENELGLGQFENVEREGGAGVGDVDPQPDGVVHRRRFNNVQIRRILNIPQPRNEGNFREYYENVIEGFQNIVNEAIPYAAWGAYIQVTLRGDFLNDELSQIVRYGEGELTDLQQLLDRLVQSNQEILNDSNLEVIVDVINIPRGGGNKRKLQTMLASEIISKKARHMFIINNNTNACFAINLAHLLHENFTDAEGEKLGLELQEKAGFTPNHAVALNDIINFEKIIDCKAVVYYQQPYSNNLQIYQTPTPIDSRRVVYFFLHNQHFYGIKSIKGFLGVGYVCANCFKGYDLPHSHRCETLCNVCHTNCRGESTSSILCERCNFRCSNDTCFERHRTPRVCPVRGELASPCDKFRKCEACGLRYYQSPKNPKPHTCKAVKCNICDAKLRTTESDISTPHLCYLNPPEKPNRGERAKRGEDGKKAPEYVFFDFETSLSSGTHIPVYVCAISDQNETMTAEGPDCALQFLRHFRAPFYRGVCFISHYGKAFDNYIVLNAMVKEGVEPRVVSQGNKIILILDSVFEQRYIDSHSFLSMPLRKIPDAMGCSTQMRKGYFPHHFTDMENFSYVGPYPPPDQFGPDQMPGKERVKFYQWYDGVKHQTFNFHKEMIAYCKNNVKILREGCLRFLREFKTLTGCDPFSTATIASAALLVYRTKFLPRDTIAIPDVWDYRRQYKSYSNVAIQWLEFIGRTRGIEIRHALRGGEVSVGRFHLDGYAEVEGEKWAFEFLGCQFHGCPTCNNEHDICPLTRESFGALYVKTREKLEVLHQEFNMNVESIWEHEWAHAKTHDPQVQHFLSDFEPPEPLRPQEALFGGRTSAIRLRYDVTGQERVRHVDFTSLYPYTLAKCEFPVGHPEIIHSNFKPLNEYFGLIKATVNTPRELFFPVLPSRLPNGKLVFTLCRTCAIENRQEGACGHSDTERALTGVWVSAELNLALDRGYSVVKVHEVWHFPQTSGELFRDYIKTFLKVKQQASGYPDDATDDEGHREYIKNYLEREGIELEPDKMVSNGDKRQVAKLLVDSLWGKLAQRSNMLQTCIVSDPGVFFNFFCSDLYKISSFAFVNDEVALIRWRYKSSYKVLPGKTNIFIACQTTAWGRLTLYKELEKLGRRVLYHDTDSIVYISRPGEYEPTLGNYLGELTSELAPDEYIASWGALGPKSYCYRLNNGKTQMKCKGITLNYETCQKVNFDSMIGLIENYIGGCRNNPTIMTHYNKIERDMKSFRLFNRPLDKKVSVVYDKRRLLASGETLPFGY